MERDKVIARIRRILARTKSSDDALKHEVDTAKALARQLMDEYGLSEADVSDDVTMSASAQVDIYRGEIALALGLLVDCRAIVRDDVSFCGFKDDVALAVDLFRSIIAQGEGRAEIPVEVFSGLHHESDRRIGWDVADKAWRACYWGGFTASVTRRLRSMKIMKDEGDLAEAKYAPISPVVEEARQSMNDLLHTVAQHSRQKEDRIETFKMRAITTGRMVGDATNIVVPEVPMSRRLGASTLGT